MTKSDTSVVKKPYEIEETSTRIWAVKFSSKLNLRDWGFRYSLETQAQHSLPEDPRDKNYFSLYLYVSNHSGDSPLPCQIGFFAKNFDEALNFTENKHKFYLHKLKAAYDARFNQPDHSPIVLEGFFSEARDEFTAMLEGRKK